MGKRVALITNIPRPYRVPLFSALCDRITSRGGNFKVFYYSDINKHVRRQGTRLPEGHFQNETIPGFEFSLGYEKLISIPINLLGSLSRFSPDVVICGSCGVPGFLAKSYTIARRIPYIQWIGAIIDEKRHAKSPKPVNQALLVQHAQACITYGTAARDYVIRLGGHPNRIVTGVNVVDNDWFYQKAIEFQPEAERIKEENRLQGTNLLCVGQLVPRKGIDLMLEAFAQISCLNTQLHLNIVGKGPDENQLKIFAEQIGVSKRVHFWGAKPATIIPQFYAMADVFVFPSLYDVWGLVVNEAMACGLPVIGSNRTGAVRDLVHDGVNGFAVDPTNTDEFSARMRELITNPDLRTSMGKAALETVNQKATIDKSVSYFIEAIRIAQTTKRN